MDLINHFTSCKCTRRFWKLHTSCTAKSTRHVPILQWSKPKHCL